MSILECKGQFKAICRLERARMTGRVHHAYIFHGPEGVGKNMAALRWGAALLCSSPVQRSMKDYEGYSAEAAMSVESVTDGCGECKECILARGGNHPDIHYVSRDSARFSSKSRNSQLLSLPIDVIREFVLDQASNSPVRGGAKVFIIDEAETMLWQAQNALLKTLEEPPSNTYIILVSSEPEKFLSTIRSRSQMVRFDPLPAEMIRSKLLDSGVNAEEALFWSEFCEGRLGAALTYAELGIYQSKQELYGKLSTMSHSSVLETGQWIIDFSKEYGKRYIEKRPNNSSSDGVRQGQELALQLMMYALGRAMNYQVRGKTDVLSVEAVVESLSLRYRAEQLSEMINDICVARDRLGSNVNPSLTFESLLIDYCL